MKLYIGNYEVEIKAKNLYSDRFNKTDTMYFLNEMALYARQAARRQEEENETDHIMIQTNDKFRREQVERREKVYYNITGKLESEGFYEEKHDLVKR